jgi:hypothetical protein
MGIEEVEELVEVTVLVTSASVCARQTADNITMKKDNAEGL